MNSPKYVVKRIGSEYRIIRSDAPGVISSGLTVFGGGLLTLFGLRRRSTLGLLAACGGVAVAYYGLTGENVLHRVRQWWKTNPLSLSPGPTHQHAETCHSQQRPSDEIDEMSMESFPASDSPGSRHTTDTIAPPEAAQV